MRGRDNPRAPPRSGRSSRGSSRVRSHTETGIYTRRPSHESINRARVSPTPSRVSVDRIPEHEPKVSESTEVEFVLSKKFEGKKLYPTMFINRYERNIEIPRRKEDYEFKLPPLTVDFFRKDVPRGWTAHVHPEGALYFYHESRNIYTDANIIEPGMLEEVTALVAALDKYADENGIRISHNTELVLELEEEENKEISWNYYYVDNFRRTLFWIHEHDVTWLTSELHGETSLPHFKHEMDRYYWMHIEYFPHHHDLNRDMADELIGILVHSLAGEEIHQLTSPSSTVLFSVDTLSKMLSIAKEIKASPSKPESVSIHGLFGLESHPRFLHYHGQHGARLNRDQSVHDQNPKRRSSLVTILAPSLFNAPFVHLRMLEKIWIDETMCIQPWEQFIEKLKEEWQEFVLFATVLLNANVAFLAIPSVDPGNNSRTPAQVASYISIATSTGSIIVALLLIRQYRVKPRETVEEAAKFLLSKTHTTRGMETLAIVYSLPYALLMWGTLTFLLAFSLECFKATHPAALSISAVTWFLVGFLIIWTIYTAWESDDPFVERVQRKMQEVLQSARTLVVRKGPAEKTTDPGPGTPAASIESGSAV
ncbi:hypothetical protein NLI96_g800 [Meripilus lineatus]|uniref:WW domain-containing protein n=1 Tax=Meripilus lineatus TaxID=2056292 RepID=A0AAD5YIY8_9APHY|nr:hypothetical protein NLI96_g800 [Physisporinus lineatus]